MRVELELVSVNVGRPRDLGRHRGRTVLSGIDKRPVAGPTLRLGATNLEGDEQADRRVHGGPDKAVYAYPSEHFPAWEREMGRPFGPGSFGENLTLRGALEDEVRIGDVWAWGDARLQVSQPRAPCFKLGMHVGQVRVRQAVVDTGRTGWYLRVLEPGEVPARGPITVVERHPAGVSVLRVHRARHDRRTPSGELVELALLEALPLSVRTGFADRLES